MENTADLMFKQGQKVISKLSGQTGIVTGDGAILMVEMDGWANPELGISGSWWLDHDSAHEVLELTKENQ